MMMALQVHQCHFRAAPGMEKGHEALYYSYCFDTSINLIGAGTGEATHIAIQLYCTVPQDRITGLLALLHAPLLDLLTKQYTSARMHGG